MLNKADTPKPPLRAALYARVSTKDKGQETENQLLPLRAHIQGSGCSVDREYVEHESASGKVRRRQYLEMLQDAEKGKYDVLAFWSLDRFSREGAAQTLVDLQRLTRAGVRWISLQDPIPDEDGPIRDMVIAIMASLAKLETRRRSERAKAAIALRKARGESWGRKRRTIPLAKLQRMVDEDYSVSAMAREFGVARSTINARLEELVARQSPKEDNE